jgi:hypothetical protein
MADSLHKGSKPDSPVEAGRPNHFAASNANSTIMGNPSTPMIMARWSISAIENSGARTAPVLRVAIPVLRWISVQAKAAAILHPQA